MKNKLQKCNLDLYHSLQTFPWGAFPNGIVAHVLFLSPQNELLLMKDCENRLALPKEDVKSHYILLHSPMRVHKNVIGGEQYCPLDYKPGRQHKAVGEYVDDRTYHVFISAPVLHQPSNRWCFVEGVKQLSLLVGKESFVYRAALALALAKVPGWVVEQELQAA